MNENWLSKGFGIGREGAEIYERPNSTGTPERNLLMAVLERAILDYIGNDQKEAQDAGDWLFRDITEPTYYEFSFPWLCQELDLDYRKIARMIQRIPKRGRSRIAPWYHDREYLAEAG